MPKATGPASQRAMETLHRNAVKALNQSIAKSLKAGEPVPAQLIQAAAKLLHLGGVVTPKPAKRTGDRLAGILGRVPSDEEGTGTKPAALDFETRLPATAPGEEDAD